MNFGLYIHISFCRRICAYCDFYRGVYDKARTEKYPAALGRDAQDFMNNYPVQGAADTVYIGGGTPTVLPSGELRAALEMIKKHIPILKGAEFSCEGNPESFTKEKAEELKSLGVSRMSLGVQSLSNKTLSSLGRIHSAEDAVRAIKRAADHGFSVSADLMLGVPFQSEADVREFPFIMRDTGAEHLSAYMLTVSEGTALYDMVKRGEFTPDDDRSADLYSAFHEAAQAAGYIRYEVSNWALPGRECRHNLKYWTGGDYVGLGAGAYSKVGLTRFHTAPDLDLYLKEISRITDEVMTEQELAKEKVIFGLRTRFGVPADVLTQAGIDVNTLLQRAGKYFTFEQNTLRIKEEYMIVSDGVAVEYLL